MIKILGSPQRYLQGPGILEDFANLVGYLGNRFFVFGDDMVLPLVREKIESGFAMANKVCWFELFGGECSRREIARLSERLEEADCHVVVGVGGGKAADTAKALSLTLKIPVVVLSTIASTDAPTSRLIAVYSDEHQLMEVWKMDRNPDVVVVDTEVIVKAPVRFIVAGMGDALATKFEAEACAATHSRNFFNGESSLSALVLARSCYDTIRTYGLAAKRSAEEHRLSEALEHVVEANIYMSGIGFESGGLAAAHAIHAGFTMIPEMGVSFHGEKVAFGLLVQFAMENRGDTFWEDMISFYRSLGLPCTLEEIGLKEVTDEKLERIARRACLPNTYMHHMPMTVSEEYIIKSILKANAIGCSHAR